MKLAVAALLIAGGCGTGDRVAECDQLVAFVDRVRTCSKLDAAQRQQLEQSAGTLRDALGKLADVGVDRAPGSGVSTARQTCAKQHEDLRQMYEKLAPECLR